MIPALETAILFLTIAAVLRFSTWAEGWLASTPRSVQGRAPDETPSVGGNIETHP